MSRTQHILGEHKPAGRILGGAERVGRVLGGVPNPECVLGGARNPEHVLGGVPNPERTLEHSEQSKESFPLQCTNADPDELRAMAEQLQTLNSRFLSIVEGLELSGVQLQNNWEGEAWNTFKSVISDELSRYLRFHRFIQRYAEELNRQAEQEDLTLQWKKNERGRS